MGTRLRLYEPGFVYSGVQGTVDRQFLFVPNHRKENKLLRLGCPLEALDRDNDILPVPSTINIIGSAFARAQKKNPITLYWVDGNINHLQNGHGATRDQLPNIEPFFRQANSLIARDINREYKREGHLWSARQRVTKCVDDGAAEQQLFYAMTNAVKDGLVETVSESPFFSSYECLAKGKPMRFWYLDYETWWARGGPAKKGNRLKDHLQWTTLELTPLPAWEELKPSQRQTRVRKQVRAIEEQEQAKRKAEKRSVIGVPALYKTDPRDRPKTERDSGPQPLCHASEKEARDAFRRQWRDFIKDYVEASYDYRNGNAGREFPEGSYRPPILTIYLKSRL